MNPLEKDELTEQEKSIGNTESFQKAVEEAAEGSDRTGVGQMSDALETGAEAASPDSRQEGDTGSQPIKPIGDEAKQSRQDTNTGEGS